MPEDMRTHEQTGESMTADIFELLARDHRNLRALLDEIEGAEDDRQRQALFSRLVDEVEAHSQAEDDVFYTTLESAGDLADRIDEARQEHDQVEALLEDLDGLPVSGDDWIDKVREIRLLIEHHVSAEEEQIFPLARRALGDPEALRLGSEFVHARLLATEEVSSERLVAADLADSSGQMFAGAADSTLDVEHMNKRELYELARRRRIEGRSAMTKAELAAALRGK